MREVVVADIAEAAASQDTPWVERPAEEARRTPASREEAAPSAPRGKQSRRTAAVAAAVAAVVAVDEFQRCRCIRPAVSRLAQTVRAVAAQTEPRVALGELAAQKLPAGPDAETSW
jgi:hypothetical protein